VTELPHGWGSEPLSALADRGGLFRDGDWVETKDQDPAGSTRLTQLADIGTGSFRDRSDRWMLPDQVARLNCTLLEPDDVLIARMPDPIGRACVVPLHLGAAVTAVDVSILRIRRPDVHPPYVMWALNSPSRNDAMAVLQSGTTRKRISRKNLGTIRVPVPPIDEQRRIVEILEDHLSRLDAADAYLAASRRRLESLIRASLRGVLEEGGRQVALAELLETTVGGIWGKEPGLDEVDVRVVRVTELKRHGRLELATAARRAVSVSQLERRQLQEGDLLLEKSGGGPTTPVGRVGLMSRPCEPSVCSNFMQLMRPRRELIHPRYLHLYLNALHSSGRTEVLQRASTNIRNIKSSDYLRLLVTVPELSTQLGLIEKHESILGSASRLEEGVSLARSRASALRRALLHAAFTGRLTDRTSDADRINEFVATSSLSLALEAQRPPMEDK
jgi:type I restriction enzyme, S subunit